MERTSSTRRPVLSHGRQNACTRSAAADLRRHLDLVALGTITDIVPLTGENRILARHGLARLNQSECLGLRTLAETAGITRDIDVYEVSFLLGPRLNAAGRLGDALKALELLLTAEPDTARRIARELDSTNRERQRIEKEMFLQATRELDRAFDPARDFGLVLARDDWHPGVIGIVASKLVQRYGRPVVCIALDGDAGRGSSRSIEGFDLVRHLGECADLLVKHGGHAMAAGLEIETPRLDTFRHRFNELARRTLAGQDLRPVQRVDAWIDLGLVDDDLLRLIDGLRPFGHSCPAPVWAARGVRLAQPPRLVGQNTLKLVLASGGVEREAVAFGMGDRPVPDGPLDVAFQARRDHFNGQDRLSLVVQDFRPSATEENG